ncbi:sigma factor-like helix-turn-helix DNA-binding protein [Alkalihalobacillus pseudalcaliphilus]|uniref:sigma factor-like helix-turn-helix DNA-binding protein n=1 Tax=Alkalihalobacillus pseudalcaliphilus TaxID=79884 RepID=UPI00064D80C4|nr:sigma factor-like helix-turn-helix DNA-binding protein [Alkalihalobacillus pseudalcaliphilus]KMK76870.1 hypothetical protein AB990_08225 [Alkalihalobacillus pseudalcaliphilus]
MEVVMESQESQQKRKGLELEQKLQLFYPAFFHYCLKLTSNKWDAEDLMQGSIMKVLNVDYQDINYRLLTKVASRLWIDQWRKRKFDYDENIYVNDVAIGTFTSVEEVEAAMEKLVNVLTKRQQVLFLLVEVFQFRANEVAAFFQTTEGAIKAALHRMRKRLETSKGKRKADFSAIRVQALAEAFRKSDIKALILLGTEEESYLHMVRQNQQCQATNKFNSRTGNDYGHLFMAA